MTWLSILKRFVSTALSRADFETAYLTQPAEGNEQLKN